MVDYNNGKIYKIVCHTTNKIYIGSTTKEHLSRRLSCHIADYKRFVAGKSKTCITSRFVLENNNYSIELIELVPCESRSELTLREAYYIRTIECVNNGIPHRTWKEYYQDNKENIIQYNIEYYQKNKEKKSEYYQDNKEIITEKKREYRRLNKDKINKFYQDNKEAILEKQKEYYQKNKEKCNQKIECECGSVIYKRYITRHTKTKRHQKYIQENHNITDLIK
jgi:hypothetical protein